jgi:hypothetical protein
MSQSRQFYSKMEEQGKSQERLDKKKKKANIKSYNTTSDIQGMWYCDVSSNSLGQ